MPPPAAAGRRGFANPEWLILLFGTGIVLAIVIPAVLRAVHKRGDLQLLSHLRRDVAAYESAHKGAPPATLQEAFGGPVPLPRLDGQHQSFEATAVSGPDNGAWGYDAGTGRVWINCTHTDAGHKVWADY